MEPTNPAPGDKNSPKREKQTPVKKERKFMKSLKKVGFKVWLAVMIIGGALAFITALFLI